MEGPEDVVVIMLDVEDCLEKLDQEIVEYPEKWDSLMWLSLIHKIFDKLFAFYLLRWLKVGNIYRL